MVLVTALGISATTAVFGLLDGLGVAEPAVREPSQLVWFSSPSFSYPVFKAIPGRTALGFLRVESRDLVVGGNQDADSGTGARGRWIPTMSVDQYASTLALWYGLSNSDLALAFPNIGRFATADVGFMM